MMADFNFLKRIPPACVKHFDGVVSHNCILWSPTKKSWHISLEKVDNNLHFQKGWSSFVQDNSLEIGDLLVFRYSGDSQFHVEMHSKNCCKKPVTTNVTMRSCKPSQNESKSLSATLPSSFSEVAMGIEEDKALRASTIMSNSKYPSFKLVMLPTSLQYGHLDLPIHFVKMHIKESAKNLMLLISDMSWPVKLATYQSNRVARGWRKCVRENSLQLGDVCVFELINRDAAVLKVSIFRHII